MVYYTGNSCKHQGYAEFNPETWPSACAPTKNFWIAEETGFCGEGDNYPEEFWNCADISITSDGDTGPAPTTVDVNDDGEDDDNDEYKYEEPTPSPLAADNDDQAFMPLGFAPNPSPPTTAEYEDPVGEYDQCGGTGYEGSTCCTQDYECQEMADCYSECRPRTTSTTECSEEWGQCGGIEWDGPTCCFEGSVCRYLGEYYSQCFPAGIETSSRKNTLSHHTQTM